MNFIRTLTVLTASISMLTGGGVSAAVPVSVTVSELVGDVGSNVRIVVYEVPPNQTLAVEYVSFFLDIAVDNKPTSEIKIEGGVIGPNGLQFPMGYMDEYEETSRGTPNFLIASPVHMYFDEGTVYCYGTTNYGGVNLNFGTVQCSLSGRLVKAR